MVKETEFYELLQVEVAASEGDIKRAYRRLALRYHPDKNPDDASAAEMFKKISHAYETLSDAEKRQLYDQHGKEGLESGGGGGGFHDASDIFSMFFGGGRRSEPKPRDLVHELPVTLEELYNGRTRKVQVTRDRRCDACGAQGVKPGAKLYACTRCRGTGAEQRLREVFPGMREVVSTVCAVCRGQGAAAKASDVCQSCNGHCITREKKILEVVIERGARHNDVIRFAGEGDHAQGMTLAGDVLIFLSQKEHDVFVRKGNHLLMKYAITLQEALCGFELPLEHLDGRLLSVTVPPGQVIDAEAVWQVYGEGMPLKNTGGTVKGNIFVLFHVEWPQALPLPQIEKIAEAFNLPPRLPVMGGQCVELTAPPRRAGNSSNSEYQRQQQGSLGGKFRATTSHQRFANDERAAAGRSRRRAHRREYKTNDDEDWESDTSTEWGEHPQRGGSNPHVFAQQSFSQADMPRGGGQTVQCAPQ